MSALIEFFVRGQEYFIHLGILICIYLILAQSFNLSFGVARIFNLAHVAAYALGAYATALLSTDYGRGFFVCTIASMCVSALLAVLLGAIALRLTQDYFAIGTLAFSAVISALLINWKSLTRGVLGIPGIPRPEILDIDFYANRNFLMLAALMALATLIILHRLFRASYGRQLRAQGESELVSLALGIPTRMLRNLSFVIASSFAGLAGSLFAYYMNYIDPSSFALHEMVFVLTIVVVGRPGSFFGVVGSTFLLVLLPEPLRFMEIPSSILGPMRQMIYALILFAVVYVNRYRLFPVQRTV
ncbi:MAG: branched-chain amino acid ABC transporter permease [Bdellovibrionota bacterium]|nr:MAG: branched-chain amino acid ABC transporter permease [Bdellovibrionota bacterium]